MDRRGLGDMEVASKIKCHRSQINRIRRGVCDPSLKTARQLQSLTGIPWHQFIRKREEA
jgi:ribosome-binding protein aMBF1 (putative translation factor)